MDTTNKRRHTQLAYGHSLEQNLDREQEHKRSKGAAVITKQPPVPKGRIPVKPTKPPLLPGASSTKTTLTQTLDWHACEPWEKVTKIFKQGSATICSGSAYGQLHVSIQQRTTETREIQSLRRFTHRHIVDLLEVFNSNGTVFFMYEYMDVSLRNIASLKARLSYSELGLACKAVSVASIFISPGFNDAVDLLGVGIHS